MARKKRKFSLWLLIACILLLVCSLGITVLEYFNLFTDNLFNSSNNIAQWPSQMDWFYLTKFVWFEKLTKVEDLFFLLVIPAALFWGVVNLLAVIADLILSLLALIVILILMIITGVLGFVVGIGIQPLLIVLSVLATMSARRNDYTIFNKFFTYFTNTLIILSTVLFFILAFSH